MLRLQLELNRLRLLVDSVRRPGIDQSRWISQISELAELSELEELQNSSHTSGHMSADTCPITDTCPPPALENEKPHCNNDPKLAI